MLIKQTLLYLPAQFFGPLFQFLSVIVWTHWLAPEEMGIFALATVSAEITYLLSLSWFSAYGLRYFPETGQDEARASYLRAEITILLVAGLVHGIAAAWLAQIFESAHAPLTLSLAIGAYFLTRSLDVHLSERARADQHIAAYTILQTAGPVAGLVVGVVLLETMHDGVVSVLLGYAIPQFIAAVVAMRLIGVSFSPRWPDRGLLEPALRYGLPLLGTAALAWCADHAIRYIVEYRLGSASLGLLSVGWGLGLRTSAFAAMLVAAAAFPLASKMLIAGKREEALQQLRTNAALLLALQVPALVGLWCISDQLIGLVIAEEYRAMTAQILPIALIVGGARQARMHITDQMFILDHSFRYAAAVNLFDIALSVVAIFVGLSWHGVVGAAEGAVVGAVAATLLSLVIAVVRSGFRYPFSDVGRIAAAAAVMALVLKSIGFPPGYFGLVLAILVGASVYVVTMTLLFPSERRRVVAYARARLQLADETAPAGVGED
jgi:O-antigen/teichoic acid export membrane protein